jgi:hypothetical protein
MFHQAKDSAASQSTLSKHHRGFNLSATPSWTAKSLDRLDQWLLNGGQGATSETALPRGTRQRLYEVSKRLPKLTAALFRRIVKSGYMILSTLLGLRDSIRNLAKGPKEQSLSVSLRFGTPGWIRTCVLAMLPLCAAAQSIGDVSVRSSLPTMLPDGADSDTAQLPAPDDLWIIVGCFTMIILGGLYMAWRWWYTKASMPWLSLMGTLTAVLSVAWTAVAFTVEPSDTRRYLGLAGWCMFAMMFLSEPLPGVSHINRRDLSQFDIAGPAACIFLIRLFSGGFPLDATKFLSGGFTIWWVALRVIFYHSRESQPTDEENGDGENGGGIGMGTLGDQADVVDNDQAAANE